MSEPGYKTTLERQQDALLDFVNDFHLEIDEISLQVMFGRLLGRNMCLLLMMFVGLLSFGMKRGEMSKYIVTVSEHVRTRFTRAKLCVVASPASDTYKEVANGTYEDMLNLRKELLGEVS